MSWETWSLLVYGAAFLSALTAHLAPRVLAWGRRTMGRSRTVPSPVRAPPASVSSGGPYRESAAPIHADAVPRSSRRNPLSAHMIVAGYSAGFMVAAFGDLVGIDFLRPNPVLDLLWSASVGWVTGCILRRKAARDHDDEPSEPAAGERRRMRRRLARVAQRPPFSAPRPVVLIASVVSCVALCCMAMRRASAKPMPGDSDV